MQDAEAAYRMGVGWAQVHGHCRVPRNWQQNQALALWVESVRARWRARDRVRLLTHVQEERLKEIG